MRNYAGAASRGRKAPFLVATADIGGLTCDVTFPESLIEHRGFERRFVQAIARTLHERRAVMRRTFRWGTPIAEASVHSKRGIMTNSKLTAERRAESRGANETDCRQLGRYRSVRSRVHRSLVVLPCVAVAAMACESRSRSAGPQEETTAVAHSATALVLGTTQSFAVLAGSTVTNTGPTVVTGDLGVSPGSAVTGFPPGLVNGGTIQAGNAVALQAQNDA